MTCKAMLASLCIALQCMFTVLHLFAGRQSQCASTHSATRQRRGVPPDSYATRTIFLSRHHAGKRGLEALSHLDLSAPTPAGSQAPSTLTNSSSSSIRSASSSNAGANAANAGQGLAGLWTPGSANLGVLQGSGGTELHPEPVPGLLLLQGMVVTGPQGQRREEYSRATSRSKGTGGGGATGNKTAGIGEHFFRGR
jgi:hypothetical protein